MRLYLNAFCLVVLFLFLWSIRVNAGSISGKVLDQKGMPLSGVSISLLYPSDSTLATFGISNKEGVFSIKDASEEHYVLQAAAAGYYSEYIKIDFAKGETYKFLPDIILEKHIDEQKLKEIVISGERVPIKIKGDTVEYNAGSYRVKPNAPVEDLLRQLPGVQVDEKGNVKAMGKDVNKILVDGKDFFGTDPKIATKNLPADAIDKIQTFAKNSDQSIFSGIDDGTRDQTINLQLKANKRKGYFGDVKAGAGNNDRFDGSAKVFQFRPKTQAAVLGSINNTNQFGFSFEDYINFNGGIGNLMRGGSLSNAQDLPVDFGQPITGENTSGALGLNYSIELRPQNRFSINFISSALSKKQENKTVVQNYLPSGDYYTNREDETIKRDNLTNNLAIKWYNQSDSNNLFIVGLNAQLKNSRDNIAGNSQSDLRGQSVNTQTRDNQEQGNLMKWSADASWTRKLNNTKWKIIELNTINSFQQEQANHKWNNVTEFTGTTSINNRQFQDNTNKDFQSNFNLSSSRQLHKNIYLQPQLKLQYNLESLERVQGLTYPNILSIDSLSPQIQNSTYSLAPDISIKNGSRKQQWSVGVQARNIWMNPEVNKTLKTESYFFYLLPFAHWRKELRQNTAIEMNYSTNVVTPEPKQLLPVEYSSSPLSSIKGSLWLRPEYHHNIHFNFTNFNQFEMSSFFASIGGEYAQNKITTAINVLPNLSRQAQWVNTNYSGNIRLNGSYDRPIKKLGIGLRVEMTEMIQLSESPVNNVLNQNTTYVHEFSSSIGNRKHKDKWNARIGFEIQISDARYSINKEFNNLFYNYTTWGYFSYQPNKKWFMAIDARLRYYTAQSFDNTISVPLLGVEITRFVFPLQRGAISFKAFDLLNKNQSVIRQGLNNYLVEQTSNVIRQYFMLSFSYKLNKLANN